MAHQGDVTSLLLRLQQGDASVLERLPPLLYEELRRLADSLFRRERPNHTLQPTAVVHEAYMRLVDGKQITFHTRAEFFAIAARVMRQVLVDHSRARGAQKRGGGEVRVALDEQFHGLSTQEPSFLALHDALNDLAKLDERKARIIELRYFGGLTGQEIADMLEVGTATVTRDLRMAEAWLARALTT